MAAWLALSAPAFAEPETAAEQRPVRFHDPSTPVKQGERWWIFSTGNGISTRHSTDLKTWREGEPVFKPEALPAWHREVVPDHKGHLWAPDIIHLNGRYFLYYSVSSWGSNRSAIGLATSRTLDPLDPAFGWKDEGIVFESHREDPYNAIDPHLLEDDDGKLWMSFGSFWSGMKLIELDPKTGGRHKTRRDVHHLAWHEEIEAPAILKRGGYYHLFVNWGRCCRGVDSTYEIRIGRSRSITGPYLDRDGRDMATGGGTLLLATEGDRIGPGHPSFIGGSEKPRMFYHYYDRRRNGFSTLASVPLRWSRDGWPEILREAR